MNAVQLCYVLQHGCHSNSDEFKTTLSRGLYAPTGIYFGLGVKTYKDEWCFKMKDTLAAMLKDVLRILESGSVCTLGTDGKSTPFDCVNFGGHYEPPYNRISRK